MSHVTRLAVTGALVMLLGATAAQAQDISGRWQFTVELDVGGGRPTFVFRQNGDTLSGTFEGMFGTADVSGTIQGDEVEFWFDLQGTRAVYTGTVGDNTMSGTCDYSGVGSGVWEAEKADEVA